MTSPGSNVSPQSILYKPIPVGALPPVARFWRRLVAAVLDGLLLGIVGSVVGWAMGSFFFGLGPYGRLLGYPIILAYFGLLNSRLGGGQTLGKRMLGIAVRNASGDPISVRRSLVRIAILAIPAFLNGWQAPIMQHPAMQIIAIVLIFGVGAAIAYTMLFNWSARQGVHDLLCGTYVVHLSAMPIVSMPQTRRVHRAIAVALVVIVPVLAAIGSLFLQRMLPEGTIEAMARVQQAIVSDGRFSTAGVAEQTVVSTRSGSARYLNLQVWYKGEMPGKEGVAQIVRDIAQLVLASSLKIDGYDAMRITVTSAFDIGIASGYQAQTVQGTISEWREQVTK